LQLGVEISVQFCTREPIPGLGAMLGMIGDVNQWEALAVLLAPEQAVDQRPIALLQEGNNVGAIIKAVILAQNFRKQNTGCSPLKAALDADLEADLRADRIERLNDGSGL
jgi:hypothetical protein